MTSVDRENLVFELSKKSWGQWRGRRDWGLERPPTVLFTHRGTRGTGTPTFWTEGTVPHFLGRKGEEFAVTCCQQRRSVEIKLQYNTIFGRGSAPDPAGRAHDALPDPRVGRGGDTCSTFRPFGSGPMGRSRSELVPLTF